MSLRFRRPLSLCAAALLLVALPARAQHFPSTDSLAALVKARVGARGMGMVLGVVEADGTTRIVSAGTAGTGAKPLGPKSVFEMGSITKAFTGTLLADAVERGLVKLDDPVAKHLPANVKMPTRGGRQITLLDLATHRSSLTRMPTNMKPDGANPYPPYTIPEMYAFLSGHTLRRDIGSEYEYSNIGVALLGHVLERVNGKPYEELVQERILRPLGMSMSSTRAEGPMQEWLTVGHDARGLVAPYRGWAALPGMGALRSNAEDMLKFLAANAKPADTPLGRAMRVAQQPRNESGPNAKSGLNWRILEYGDRRIINHGGATQGFVTVAAFDPDAHVGVVVLANYPASMNDLALHLLNPKIPLSGATVAERTEIDLPADVLRRYVGDYELRPTFSLNVTLQDGALWMQGTGQRRTRLFPEAEIAFFSRDVNAQVSFARDAAGAVTGLVLHQGGRDQPARRRAAPGVPLGSAAEIAAALPGRKASIASRALGGERALRIVVPRNYEMSQSSRYPVLYVLDTERPIHSAAPVATMLATALQAPEMIVVHVGAPPAASQRAAFARFLADELQPWIAREYRTAPFGVLVGDAATVAAAGAFPARIAVGPDHALTASLRDARQPAAAPTEPHAALEASLRWIYDGWALPDFVALASQPGGAGLAAVDAHYAKLSQRYGYAVVPPEELVDRTAMGLGNSRRFDEAIRLLERNRDYHPGSGVVLNHLGDAYRILCRLPEAKEQYAKAHAVAQALSYPNVQNYAMELARVTEEIEARKPCTPPGARSSVAVPEATLRGYVGEYELSARLSIAVTYEDGRLHAQPTGEGKRPVHPETEATFAVDGSPIRFTFTRDAAGAVNGMTLHQGGRDQPARKVK
jgi:CubicO group peptidase (beta-lactamase class C family)